MCTCAQTLYLYLFPIFCLQVESTAEGEAQRYFDHALTLKNTILFLRYNKELTQDQGPDIPNIGKFTVAPSFSSPLLVNVCTVQVPYISIHVIIGSLKARFVFVYFYTASMLVLVLSSYCLCSLSSKLMK